MKGIDNYNYMEYIFLTAAALLIFTIVAAYNQIKWQKKRNTDRYTS